MTDLVQQVGKGRLRAQRKTRSVLYSLPSLINTVFPLRPGVRRLALGLFYPTWAALNGALSAYLGRGVTGRFTRKV